MPFIVALNVVFPFCRNAIVTDSHNPYHRVWELLSAPESSRARVSVESRGGSA